MLQRHALFHVPTARTAFGGRKPAGSDEDLTSCRCHLVLQEGEQLPHRRICDRTSQLPVRHHPQDVEILDADRATRACQFRGEFVLHIGPDGSDLLMLAGDLEPLFFIVAAEGGSAGFRVFRFFLPRKPSL